MENKRAFIVTILGTLVAMFLIWGYVERKRDEMTEDFGPEVEVVVAAKAIPEYGIIQANMLEKVRIFKNFRQPQTVDDMSQVVGRAAYVPIYPGEQITLTKLIQSDGKPVLDRQVEKTKRAVTIQIAPQTGVGRLIRPGNHVDVIASPNYDTNGATVFEIKTIAQNVLVLATGKNIQNQVPTHVDRDVLGAVEEELSAQKRKDVSTTSLDPALTGRPDDNYTSITLQLSTEDAEKILLLSHMFGDQRLYFTLRNGADNETPALQTTLLDQVLGPNSDYGLSKRKPPPALPPKPPRFYDAVGSRLIPIK